ncbi:hypothetical protein Purlil1_13825 [Purpureocillium lilacinum]|uniref:Uncharacterized protein n=1 Tax=Purpureocillium lilacinum TaxID=33203 RepID=A0ABR0BD19_PURLI|nr:hypothetical protein Purlil1_13825 [Purpureocillium lilacinum]
MEGGRPRCELALARRLQYCTQNEPCRRSNEAVSVAGKRGQGVECGGVENRGVKDDGVEQRSGWWAEWQGTWTLVRTPCTTPVLPLVLGNVLQVAIQKRLQSSVAASRIPLSLIRIPFRGGRGSQIEHIASRAALRSLQPGLGDGLCVGHYARGLMQWDGDELLGCRVR